jgi:hypothetical protein
MVGATSTTSQLGGDEIVGSILSRRLFFCTNFLNLIRQTPSGVISVDFTLVILALAGNWSTLTIYRLLAILLFSLRPTRLRAGGLATR